MFEKFMHYMMRAEIYMMGFRRSTILGVDMALDRRGIKDALTYSNNYGMIMILHKDRTVIVSRNQLNDKEDFVDYIYDQLDPWNWD